MFADQPCIFINIHKFKRTYNYEHHSNDYYDGDLDMNCDKAPSHKKVILMTFALMVVVSTPFIIYELIRCLNEN